MSEKVLLIGTNVRNVAESARKAGYEVYAIAKYIDADLLLYAKKVYPESAALAAKEIAEKLEAKIVLCSNYETFKVKGDLLCNAPKEVMKVVDKLKFYRELEKAGIPHPELLKELEGECILKPRFGGGGENISFAKVPRDGFLVQRYIDGVPCSVSLLISKEILPLACNLIFSGWKEMNADGFRYSGNLTPLNVDKEKILELEKLAIETVELFNLKGSVGVDFILADKPYVLEVNPRFQGSLDSIEWSCDVNLFSLHVKAFNEEKIERVKPKRFAIRAIFFASEEIKIKADLVGNPFFADVPHAGSIYKKGEPVVSILASGKNGEEAIKKALERKDFFLKLNGAGFQA